MKCEPGCKCKRHQNGQYERQHARLCSVDGCGREYHARDFCLKHYIKARRQGKLPRVTPEDRFEASFDIDESGCWPWTGQRDIKGYGALAVGGKKAKAHRWVWETYVGPIPDGWQIDHLCRNPSCVNIDHLEPVTNAENTRRRFEVVHRCLDCGSENIEAVSPAWKN